MRMANVQYEKNGIMPNIIGFIDATVRPCCRPVHFQQEVYNGKDCVHALKFQTVMMADGIICHVSGPWSGRRHDTHIFQNSQLPGALAELPRMPISNGGELMALYADPGRYNPSRRCLLCIHITKHRIRFECSPLYAVSRRPRKRTS